MAAAPGMGLIQVEAESGGSPGAVWPAGGLVERQHLWAGRPGTPGEEGRHSKWRMEGPNDGDHWWALLMSVVGKVKMAALLG